MRSSGTPFMKLGLESRAAIEEDYTLWFKVWQGQRSGKAVS
jgi:hypothetical protein